MAKITVKARPLSHKHRAWLSKYTSQFIHDVSTVPLCELSGLIQSFPRGWPFPRGDLHVWISALDRFDEILESFISVYKLKDGPQYLPFGSELLLRSTDSEEPSHANNQQTVSKPFLGEEADLELIKTILGFSALLLENCGNRSLYNSGEHLNQLLNSTSLSLVNSTLEVSVCLAQRYHASIVRHRSYNRGVNSPFAMSSSIERFIYFAVHQPTLIDVAQQPSRDHDQKGKTRASVREALEGVAIPTSALFSLTPLRDDDKIRQASELRFSYHQHNHLGGHQEQQAPRSRDMRAPVQTTAQRGTPRRTNTLSRRTAVDGATGGSTENEPSSPQQGTSRIYKTTVESQSRVLQLSREELLGQPLTNTVARCIHILPDDCKNAFLATLRVAHAILDPMNHSDKVLRMKLLSLIILAHILPEADFEKKILSQDSDQPRRRQLAYQLVDLIRPNSHDQFPVPLKTQTLALETLESLMRQRRRSVAVTSAMSTHVNHGVPFALLRQVLEEIKSTSHLTGNSIEYRWQEALFSLLSKLVSELDRIADGLISAGSFVLIVQVLETRGPGAESSVCHLLGFLDHLIHSSRNGFQIFATEGGLQALANLTARQVKQAADKRGSSGMPQDHRSTLADFTIPLGEQSVLRSVFKLISHAFSHGGTGFDRLLRNLVDSSQLLDALRQIISQPSEYGSAVWSAAVAVVVNFIHHEPTSYAILAEAGLSQAFVDCLTVRSAPSDGDITAIGNVTLASDFFAIRSPVPVGPDAIMAAAQAFGAICLNASGLRLIQDSNVLTEFLLLFASPRHVQNMSQESGFTFRLGSTFNELLRHYPTLRAKILAAIDELMGKLSSVMASEGDTAQPIDRVEDNPVRPDAGDQEVLNGPTVDLSGGDRVSRLTSSQPTGLTIPVMIGNEDVPSPQSFVEQICQFLRAFLTHPSHAASYIKAGGAESLMDLCSSQSLPFNLSQTQAAKSFSQLMIMLIEQKPYLILPSLLNRLNNNARILGPLLARSDHGFFGRFVNSDQNGDEFSPQPTVRALLNAQTLCAAVIRSSQPSPYDRRPRESAIAQVNTLDMYEELLPAIGRLVVACSTELNRLEASVPSGWVKDSDSDFSNMRVSLNSANPSIQAQTPLPPPAIGEAQMLDAGATSTSEQAVSPSHGQSGIGFKNTQVLIWLLSEVADTLTQFLHHVCKHIVGKRQADMDARRVANRVADSVAQMLVAHLRESYDQLSMQAATGFTSLRSCLKLTAKLLFDDGRHGHQALTLVLKSFKEHDGLELLDKLLEHCWRRLADTGGEPKRTGGDQEQSGKSRDINLHCVHAILDIFAWMTTSRYIIDVPQSLELSGRTSDRKNPDFFRPAVFLVELRIAILPVATRLWRLEYTSKTPSSVVKRLLKVLRIAMDGDSEGGAFAPQSYRISSKSAPDMDFEPNAQLLEQMNDEGQSEELNREALIRCYNVYDHAREYVEAQASSSRFRRYPVARRLVHDSQGTGVSTNQYAQQHPELPMDPAMPNLSADGNQSSLSRNVLETPEQPLVQPSQVNGLANSESMLGLDLDLLRHGVLDMSTDIESLLNGLTVPISGGGTIETPDSESQQTVNPSNMRSEQSGSSGTAVSLHNAIDSLRSDLLSDAIDRCIAILSSHRDVTFEMSDFLRYAIILKTGPVDVANKMREELALTLTQSLLSLYADEPAELVKNGNQIAAHAHLIALLLQNPGFSEHAMGNLKDASGELLNFVRPRGDQFSEKTPWVAYILLIMERLCSECFQPQKIEWTTSMSEAERLQLLSKSDEPFLSADTQNEVFELVINLLPRVNKDTQLALQVSRLLAILTKSLQLANAMSQMQNLQKLFLMIKQLAGLKADKVHSLVILILRHVLEDTETLTQIMRTEIAQCFEARISQRSQMDVTHYVRTMSHLILRQPEIFMSVTTELVKIPRLDSIVNAHLRSHTLVLKSTPSGDAPAGTTESNQKHISIQDRSNELTAVEESLSSPGLKLLVPNVPDGLIHFMISEVCNCPQAEEPSTDRRPGPSIDASREDADMGVKGHSSSLSEDSAQMKKAPEFKADQHPIYVYQCFLLASLTELLASYNSAKNAFVTYQRRPMSIELPTSVKSKARFLPYLLNELLPMESIEYISHEDIPGCKRKITSKWAMAAVAALCAKTGEKGFDRANDSSNGEDEPELLAVRRYALDQIQKAYRECEQISVLAMRYAKVLALSDLVYNILESPPSSGGGSSMAELLTISQKQLARLMFEKNYIRSFTDSLADMDFTFPMIERVVKYVLKTIKVLTDRVYQLSLTSSLARAEAQEVGEPSSTSSATDSDRTREETPDLFRHSALGILDPAQNESSTSISEGEDDNEMYGDEYEEELDYDDPMDDEDEDDENDEMASDDSQEMEGVSGEIPTDMEFHTGGQHDSTSDEAASLNSEEVDQDEEDVAMIDMDENSDWQGEDIDDSGIPMATGDDEYGNEDGVFEHSSSDGGGHAVASNLPINSLMESLHAEFEPMLDHPQDHTADPEFSDDDDVMVVEDEEHYSEMDEDEEMDYDEGDMDDEGEDDIFLPPPGPILLPPQHMYFDPDDEDIALGNTGHQHAPRVITQGTRHQRGGHPWLTYDNGDPLLVPNYRTAAIHRGPHAEEANPLLQPEHDLSPVVGQSGSSIPFPGGSADLSRLITTMMANRPQGPMDNRGNILDNLLSHLRDGSGIGVHRHNGTLHFSISGEPRGLVPDFQAVLGGPTPFHEPISSARDPLMTFCPCVTSSRWGEEARLLYGAATIDMARRTENTLRATLVPLAILDEQERKKTAEEERKVDEIKQKRQAEEEAEANRKAEEDKAAEEARRAAEEQTALALTGSDLSQEPPHPMVDFGSELTVGHGGSNVSAHEAGVLTRSPTDNHTTEASLPVERVVTSLRGQELDITGMDIDPGFLEALPDELREEVLMQHISERRQREAASGGQPTEINREFLNALPTDIREEVLRTEAQERRRQERAAAQQASPTQQRQAAEMDPASFLASLQPELRQTVLAEGDDEFIDQLPPDLAAEARALRRPRRAPNFDDPYLSAIDPNAGGDALTMTVPQEPTKVSVVRMLDQQGMASLLRLLFLPQDRHQSSTLSLILLSAVNNRQDREEMLGLILGLLNGITVDEVSAEKVYTQLALRAKEGDRGDKIASPATIATGQASPLSSLTLTQRCLQALLTLAGQHNRVPMFFLTEHDNHLALQPETKRGKGRSAKILRHPINTLLSLLERALLTESNGAMETYSTLLSIITTPLRNLYDRSAARTPTELPGLITEANDSTVTTGGAGAGLATTSSVPQSTGPDLSMQSVDSAQSASEAANTQEVVGITNESAKKAESLVVVRKPVPPVIPDHNLRLVVSVLAGRECSSNTFKQTLQSMESLLYVPGAVTVFGSELVKQAQLLASTTLISLNDMVSEMKCSASELELQIIRFSTASLDQTKLLRVLTALDFLFDAKKQALFNPEGSDRPDLVRPNLVAPLFVMPEFVSLWQRLGECLTIIREKENSQNLAAVLLPLIESLMVVCQNTTIKDQANLQAPTDRVVVSSPPPESQMEHLFYTFTEEHRKVLNSLVRSNPRLMSGSFALLVKNPKVLEFDNKRNYFSRQMHGRAGGIRQNYHSLSLNIRRDHVFMDTYRSMYFKSADEIKYAKLNIRFNGEEGVDAGGVTREWFSALSRQMFNPDYALFSPVAGDRTTFHPNKSSSVNDEHLLYFKFIGRIIGKALYEGKVLDCHFSRAVYRRILGRAVSIKDMESIDLDYYRSLMWILQNPIGDIITETFSIESDEFGVKTTLDLIENGRNIPVTEENKQEYVRLVTEHRLTGSVKEQLENFLVGFHDIVPPELISIFNEQELELLISGLPEIDVDDWKANTEYHSYSPSSPQVQWFWRAVRSFDKEEKAKLLQFITGTSRVPLNGFRELEGMHGFSRFNIHRDPTSKDRLPSSHTCFNQLDLPEYEDYDSLRQHLILAFTVGGEYFGFA